MTQGQEPPGSVIPHKVCCLHSQESSTRPFSPAHVCTSRLACLCGTLPLPPPLRARTRPATQDHPWPCLSYCLTPATLNHQLFPHSTGPEPLLFLLPRLPFLMFVFKYFYLLFKSSSDVTSVKPFLGMPSLQRGLWPPCAPSTPLLPLCLIHAIE